MRAPKPAPRQLPTSVVTTLQQLVRRRRTLGRPPRHSAVGMTWAEAEVPEAERAGTRTSRGHGPSRWPPFLGRRRLPRRPRWIRRRDDDVQVEGYTTRVKLLVPSSVMVLVAKKILRARHAPQMRRRSAAPARRVRHRAGADWSAPRAPLKASRRCAAAWHRAVSSISGMPAVRVNVAKWNRRPKDGTVIRDIPVTSQNPVFRYHNDIIKRVMSQ